MMNVLLKVMLRLTLKALTAEERGRFLERVPAGLRGMVDVDELVGNGN